MVGEGGLARRRAVARVMGWVVLEEGERVWRVCRSLRCSCRAKGESSYGRGGKLDWRDIAGGKGGKKTDFAEGNHWCAGRHVRGFCAGSDTP